MGPSGHALGNVTVLTVPVAITASLCLNPSLTQVTYYIIVSNVLYILQPPSSS